MTSEPNENESGAETAGRYQDCHDCQGLRVDSIGNPCVFCDGTGEVPEEPYDDDDCCDCDDPGCGL